MCLFNVNCINHDIIKNKVANYSQPARAERNILQSEGLFSFLNSDIYPQVTDLNLQRELEQSAGLVALLSGQLEGLGRD